MQLGQLLRGRFSAAAGEQGLTMVRNWAAKLERRKVEAATEVDAALKAGVVLVEHRRQRHLGVKADGARWVAKVPKALVSEMRPEDEVPRSMQSDGSAYLGNFPTAKRAALEVKRALEPAAVAAQVLRAEEEKDPDAYVDRMLKKEGGELIPSADASGYRCVSGRAWANGTWAVDRGGDGLQGARKKVRPGVRKEEGVEIFTSTGQAYLGNFSDREARGAQWRRAFQRGSGSGARGGREGGGGEAEGEAIDEPASRRRRWRRRRRRRELRGLARGASRHAKLARTRRRRKHAERRRTSTSTRTRTCSKLEAPFHIIMSAGDGCSVDARCPPGARALRATLLSRAAM